MSEYYRIYLHNDRKLGFLHLDDISQDEIKLKGNPFITALVTYFQKEGMTGHYKISLREIDSDLPITHSVTANTGLTYKFFVSHSLSQSSPFGDFTWEIMP